MKRIAAASATALAALSLAGCLAAPSPVGVWVADMGEDVRTTVVINADGSCSNAYWVDGRPLDIGGPMTCSWSGNDLVVTQAPNTITYEMEFLDGWLYLHDSTGANDSVIALEGSD